ncbi:MAG: DHHA1 domain-containing protein [Thaumarchaeota archaeon]|nr:DHHA1 domain-containing protein [Nitrososphaerota archaeon]
MPHHCISHIKDVDGVASAALVFAAKGGTFRLTDYDDLLKEMSAIPGTIDGLTICDLGTNVSNFPDFLESLQALARRMPVTYIDHHYLTAEAKEQILSLGVDLHHDSADSAAMLTYMAYKNDLPVDAKMLALYGAVTDYMDGSPNASRIMETLDRQFVLLEGTLLSYALARNGRDYAYLEMLVKELADMKVPHTIEKVGESALQQAEKIRLLAEEVRKKGTRLGMLAYMETDESATGNIAKLLLGAFDVPLGVAYKEKPGGIVEVSLRSTSSSRTHLGKEIGAIAQRHGGSGGGHEKAAGCSIPLSEFQGVLMELESLLESKAEAKDGQT